MNATLDSADSTIVRRTYSSFVDGRPVVVYGVPYRLDEDTGDYFLSAEVAERLFSLVRQPAARNSVENADTYRWEAQDAPRPQLALRFTGRGLEYGATPVSIYKATMDRVADSTAGIGREIGRLENADPRKLDPYEFEPRVSYVRPGSLEVALDAPSEGLFPDMTAQKLANLSLELLVDAADWIARNEQGDRPESLADDRRLAAALLGLWKLLPPTKEAETEVELSGQLLDGLPSKQIRLDRTHRATARRAYGDLIARLQDREGISLTGVITEVNAAGRFHVVGLEWETSAQDGTFDPTDDAAFEALVHSLRTGAPVALRGVVVRATAGKAQSLQIHFAEPIDTYGPGD